MKAIVLVLLSSFFAIISFALPFNQGDKGSKVQLVQSDGKDASELPETSFEPEPLRWDMPGVIYVTDRQYWCVYAIDEDDTYDKKFINDAKYVGEVKESIMIDEDPKEHLVANSAPVGSKVYKNYEYDIVYVDTNGILCRYN